MWYSCTATRASVRIWLHSVLPQGVPELPALVPRGPRQAQADRTPHQLPPAQVAGGRTMRLRTSDAAYLAHVDRWWGVLFSKLRRFLYQAGGPIVMVQVRV